MIGDSKAMQQMRKANTRLVLNQPFFASIALKMQLRETPDFPAVMGTDGQSIRFNPEDVLKLDMEETVFVVAHEVMHVAMKHHMRRGERDPRRWNMACDYAINPVLVESGVGRMPDEGLIDPAYSGKSAEEIYNALPEPLPGGGSGGGGTPGDSTGVIQDAPAPGTDPAAGDANEPTPKPSPGELSEMEADVDTMVAQARQVAKAAGKLPGSLNAAVDAALERKAPWEQLLRQFLTRAREAYSWTPPNRRYASQGIYMPGLKSEKLGDIVVAVDTSGSVSEPILKAMAGELTGMLEDFQGSRIRVVYCDTEINGDEEFTSDNLPVKLRNLGGGGTDFDPPFAWVEEQGLQPEALIYLTDLYGCCTANPPYPVLWVTYGSEDAPFGEVVPISLD